MDSAEVSYRRSFPCSPRSATEARRWLRSLPIPGSEDSFQTTLLLSNELLTNSIRHSGSPEDIGLEVRIGEVVTVLVTDRGNKPPEPVEPALLADRGRGLALVDALSDRWGFRLDGLTNVWFEIKPD